MEKEKKKEQKVKNMYLKRLELQGFKSFADKTILEFKPGITSVIGPNGSGKSNISDAIRWVLGEQSMKSLRGAKSEDIIFAGTQNRKSLGFAEVSIVMDNSDGELPIEYAEVTVTRKIYRSGETGYFINKAPCRLKDITELFMDTGIGKDGYSIIGQGKIDEILSNKSEDRRRIFEEAAGIVKYRTRKVESEKKLEQTKLNLLRIHDILTEIEANIGPLKQQSDKAKQYLELKEELKQIEVGVFVQNIEDNKEKLKQIAEDEDIMRTQAEDASQKMQDIQNEKENLKKEVNQLIEEIERMQNIGFESTTQIEKLRADIQVLQEKIQNLIANQKRLQKEIAELEEKTAMLEEEKKSKEEKKDSLFTNKEKFEKQLQEKETELQQVTQSLSTKELEMEEKKKEVEQATDEKYDWISQENSFRIHQETAQKKQKNCEEEINKLISQIDMARQTKQEMANAFYETEKAKLAKEKEVEALKNERMQAQETLDVIEEERSKLQYAYRMKESRYHFLQETEREKEGYTKSVKALLTACEKDASLKQGVHDVLANVIQVKKEYEVAIEVCLGQALQNIVTQTEKEAQKLIQYLRTHNLGRASFLPISSVKGKKLEKWDAKGVDGVIGLACDVVKTKKDYEQIIWNLLGRTVLTDTMENAVALAKQNGYAFRIVTLQGDVIHPSGAMTGGSMAPKTVNILGRGREIEELEKALQDMQKQLEAKQVEKETIAKQVAAKLDTEKVAEEEWKTIEIEYATKQQEMQMQEEKLQSLQARREEIRKEKEQLVQEEAEYTKQQEIAKQEIANREERIEVLTKAITHFANENKEKQTYIDNLHADITDLRISVSSFDESGASLDEIMERITNEIQENKTSIEQKKAEIEQAAKEAEEKEEHIQQQEQTIIQIQKEVASSEQTLESFKQSRTEKNEKLSHIEKEVTSQFETLEDLKGHIVKIEVKKSKVEQDIQDQINSLWNEYEVTPNTAQEFKRPDNLQKAQREVNVLKTHIRELGSINVDAIEEYKKTKQRYDFMCEQRVDLEDTVTKLRGVISQMTDKMKEQFAEKFAQINKNFNEVFIELFGGGRAELILEDENNILECGIDIRVQPTGKKLQNMMLLSGGEKAFTAIALLFAILKINPAPFCILDEIEAALDDVNVYRYADYLKKFCKETQFLVITHRKGTMEAANSVYGITMEENGVSKLLSLKLK